jgi:transcriptional regulator with XRE-family HTH domain
MSISEFGNRVASARKDLDATVADIAFLSQISSERIELIEKGADKSINALEIHRLAFALGTTHEFLMFGKVVTS